MTHTVVNSDHKTPLRTATERLTAEFGDRIDPEAIERLVMSSYESMAKTATVTNFLPLLAEKFARQRLRAIDREHNPAGATRRPMVLFLCVKNAGRSQMALGFLQHHAGETVLGMSGGSAPGGMIDPVAVEVMAEKGIDVTGEFPKPWTDEILRVSDVIVTMGCGDECPVLPGKSYVDWELTDPAGKDIEVVRGIRDDIEQRVLALVEELTVAARA